MNPDGSVTVIRDSPWDDDERDAQHALDELVCPSCGNLRSVCSDPDVSWYPQRNTCYATAAREVAKRRVLKRHEKTSPGQDMHPLDGLSVWVSRDDLTPDDDFC